MYGRSQSQLIDTLKEVADLKEFKVRLIQQANKLAAQLDEKKALLDSLDVKHARQIARFEQIKVSLDSADADEILSIYEEYRKFQQELEQIRKETMISVKLLSDAWKMVDRVNLRLTQLSKVK